MSWLGDSAKWLFNNTVYNLEQPPYSTENMLNIAFLGGSVVAGVFTGGLGTAAMFTARGALMGTAKTIGKTMVVEASEAATKRAAGESVEYLSKRQVRRIAEDEALQMRGRFNKIDFSSARVDVRDSISGLNHNLSRSEVGQMTNKIASTLANGTPVGRNTGKLTAGVLAANFTRNVTSEDVVPTDAISAKTSPELLRTATQEGQTGQGFLGMNFDKAVKFVDGLDGTLNGGPIDAQTAKIITTLGMFLATAYGLQIGGAMTGADKLPYSGLGMLVATAGIMTYVMGDSKTQPLDLMNKVTDYFGMGVPSPSR